MTGKEQRTRFKKPITVAAILTILGLITAVIYMWIPVQSRYSALSMVIFLMAGVPMMAVAIAIFLYLWRADVKTRLSAWTRDRFGPGQIIIKEGDPGNRLYFIEEGEVEVVRNGAVLAKLGRGENFGEVALLTGKPRNATVRTVGDVEVISIGREQFDTLTNLTPVREAFEKLSKQRQP